MGLEASLAVARSRHVLAVLLGRESATEFLARREPTFTVGQWAAHHLPGNARLIGQDHRGFLHPARLHDGAGPSPSDRPRGTRRIDRAISSPNLCESGFTHVMFCPPVPETAVEFDPTLGRLLAPWIAGHTPVFAKTSPTPTASCGSTRSTSWHRQPPMLAAAALRSTFSAIKREPGAMNGSTADHRRAQARVQKDRHREIGNWLARRVARPTAVYGCWLAIRLG